MVVEYPLYGESCTLGITIGCKTPTKISLIVEDAESEEVVFTERTGNLKGSATYYVRLPISPDVALIDVEGESCDVVIEDVKIMALPTDMSSPLFKRPDVISFINFAEEFSYDASSLQANATYSSDDDKYKIKYFEDIVNESGTSLNTPARISQNTGLIEVSKKDFLRYTIPMRLAILLHEFAHFYVNKNMEDEVEADKNSLILYMGLGYPRIDAYNVYLDVFENSPTELNKERYEALQKLFSKNYIA
jgi:hypothetical protein|tara:strand:+ start:8963 stop:9706 length:744 start_codon:yes stop_codon:yes gene_type:complete